MRCAPYFSCSAALILAQFGTLARAADDFLDPAVAFKFSATEKPGEVDVTYKIADGYYMYRERFAFATRNGTTTIGEPQLPAGHVKFDQTFNKNVETYRNELTIRIPVKQAAGPFDLAVTSQGCADAGICYPPMERVYHVSGDALQPAGSAAAPAAAQQSAAADAPWYERATSADYAQSLLAGRRILRDHRALFRRGRRAQSAAVLVSDDSDSVGDHHRRRRAGDACARVRVVAGLCHRHGARLHGAWRRGGAGRAKPRRVAAESMGARRVRRSADDFCR